jgi:hypothetical protein
MRTTPHGSTHASHGRADPIATRAVASVDVHLGSSSRLSSALRVRVTGFTALAKCLNESQKGGERRAKITKTAKFKFQFPFKLKKSIKPYRNYYCFIVFVYILKNTPLTFGAGEIETGLGRPFGSVREPRPRPLR